MTCAGTFAGSAAAAEPVLGRPPEVVHAATDEQIEEASVGEKLVCYSGSWSEVEGFKYQWLVNGAAIAGATGDIFVVERADEGGELSCEVTAVATEGNEYYALSDNTVKVPGPSKTKKPPVNTSAPNLTGTASVGSTLTCSSGEWTESPTGYTYEWLHTESSSFVEIVGAMSSTYVVQEADEGRSIECEVTAKNSGGSGSAHSNEIAIAAAAKPKDTTAPKILGATGSHETEKGATLTCSPGTWSGEPTFGYQWLLGGAPISEATGVTFTVERADELQLLSCRVTATNRAGSEKATTETVKVIGEAPENIVEPTITGTVQWGQTVGCNRGEWSGNPTPTAFEYKWLLNKVAVGEGTSYKIAESARGKWLVCQVTVKTTEGSALADSVERLVPEGGGGEVPTAGHVTISGPTSRGSRLTCEAGTWGGRPTPALSYQWLRKLPHETVAIGGASGETYVIAEEDLGYELICRVEGVNEEGNAFGESAPLAIPGTVPGGGDPTLSHGRLVVGESVSCLHGAWSGAPAPTYEYAWIVNEHQVAAGSSSYEIVAADLGYDLACEVTAHNDAGATSALSAAVRIPGSPPIAGTPSIAGTPALSEELTCEPGEWNGTPTPTLSYQWFVDSTPIPSETGKQLEVRLSDEGRSLSCEVIGTNTEGTVDAYSGTVAPPGGAPVVEPEYLPAVTGTATVGDTLTCNHGIWEGAPPPEFSVQWLLDEEPIAGATGATLGVELAYEGHSLSCEVTAHNESGTEWLRTETRYIPYVVNKPPPGKEPLTSVPYKTPVKVVAPPTTAEIREALSTELMRAAKAARVKKLLKVHPYLFTFAALVAGKLEYFWYLPAKGGYLSANTKPILVARASMSFSGAATKTLKLHLTQAGLEQFRLSSTHLTLKAKGVFSATGGSAITWTKKFVLSQH